MADVPRIVDVLDPRFLQEQLERVQAGDEPPLPADVYAEAMAELEEAQRRIPPLTARAAAAAPVAARTQPLGRPDAAFFPRAAATSILQSTLETCIGSRLDITEDAPAPVLANPHLPDLQLKPGEDIYRQFGPCDIRWIRSKLAEGWRFFHGTPPFPPTPAPTVALGDDARVVMVGDWGTGLESAQKVAKLMGDKLTEAAGRDRHVIHLGDVYYAGWKEEYVEHVLPYWPHAKGDASVKSWALNGNHDMYSGGQGYFGFLLRDARFQAQANSSRFKLANEHWQILALDTAYKDGDLAGDQADWVRGELAASTTATILLSHHQPFSAYTDERFRYPLLERLRAAFAVRGVDAWFWGHEHRCAVYDAAEGIGYPACMGHGGVPVLVPPPPPAVAVPGGVRFELREADVIGEDRWGLFGFAVLDFDGDALTASFFDENGGDPYLTETVPRLG